MLLADIISKFEKRIPLTLQEKWDHSGLNLGDPQREIKSVLFAYDVCLETIAFAKKKKCNLIVSHHPFRMSAAVDLRLDTYEGRVIEACLKNGIALYSSHTNHDASKDSLNFHYLKKLGLTQIKPLSTTPTKLFKLAVYVPVKDSEKVLDALFSAGAGRIGNYGECSFRTTGLGTFKGDLGTNPTIGKVGVREEVKEERFETIVKESDLSGVIAAMKKAHPYEEVAYDIFALENKIETIGLGAVGTFEKVQPKAKIIADIKTVFGVNSLRLVDGKQSSIKKIAICTGSGASLLPRAFAAKADLFITGDVKYHQAIEAKRHDLILTDVGHFPSEKDSVLILRDVFKALFGKKLVLYQYDGLKDAFECV